MRADLHLSLWQAAEFVEEADQEAWHLQQAAFFAAPKPEPKAQAGGRKRKRTIVKGPRVIVKERRASFACLRALDNALLQGTKIGLADFMEDAEGSTGDLCKRSVLVIFLDEASTNMAMAMWLQYKVRLRMIFIRDVFHREWNDVSLAVRHTGLWWVVLLSSLAFNLPFGPWDGSGWWEQLKEGARDLLANAPHGGPLFDALYSALCKDRREEALGYLEHTRAVLTEALGSNAFCAKGEKVALRRWFSFFKAAQVHDASWHSRLLAVVYIGIKSGVYRDCWDCPFLGGVSTDPWRRPETEEPAEEEERPTWPQQQPCPRLQPVPPAAGHSQERRLRQMAGK